MSKDHDNRKRLGAVFWAALLLAAIVVYPLSLGPVAWLDTKLGSPKWLETFGTVVYAPMSYSVEHGPQRVTECYMSFINWWTKSK